jgi:hypothetical protein
LIEVINSILTVYSWVAAAILIVFLVLIGRFCELKFGQKSYHQLLLMPLAGFLVAAVWYATLQDFVGALVPDLLFALGGLALIVLSFVLYRAMMGGQR